MKEKYGNPSHEGVRQCPSSVTPTCGLSWVVGWQGGVLTASYDCYDKNKNFSYIGGKSSMPGTHDSRFQRPTKVSVWFPCV
jgi:hypothetical protein